MRVTFNLTFSALTQELVTRPFSSELEAAAAQIELSLAKFENALSSLDLDKLAPCALRRVVSGHVALTAAASAVRVEVN